MASAIVPRLVPFECQGCHRILGEFMESSRVSHAPCKAQAKPVELARGRRRVVDCVG